MLKYVLLFVGSVLYILISSAMFQYNNLRRAKRHKRVTYNPNQFKYILIVQVIITVIFDVWYIFSK